jgi:hypothetical protein
MWKFGSKTQSVHDLCYSFRRKLMDPRFGGGDVLKKVIPVATVVAVEAGKAIIGAIGAGAGGAAGATAATAAGATAAGAAGATAATVAGTGLAAAAAPVLAVGAAVVGGVILAKKLLDK